MIHVDGLNFGEGWRPDLAAEAVPRIVEEDGILPISLHAAPRARRDSVDMTAYLKAVHGAKWYLNQSSCGSCVAFGETICDDALIARATLANGGSGPIARVDPMTIYWGSRVEIGGGRVNGEGSVGIWAVKYVNQYGVLQQKKYPSADLSKYSPSVCCGPNSRRGVPDDLEPVAREHPVKSYAQVRNFDEMVTAIDLERPVTVASDQGFTQSLDRDGFARPSGTWNHQMAILGYELGRRPCGWVVNSWGEYYVGGPSGWCPAVKKVDADVLDKMFRQGDSWCRNDLDSWDPRPEIDFEPLNF